jgi:uncharacterized RDD family membrane protein YckC
LKQEFISIESPEKIRFYYKIARTGARIGAYIVDMMIQAFIVFVLVVYVIAAGGLNRGLFTPGFASDFQLLAIAFLYLVYFFLQWGYFTFFEMFKNGQTPGKKAMRINVIRANGDPLDASSIVLRNLLRAVDGFPFFHLLGGLISMLDKRSRRLGDMVADTVVVHEIHFDLEEPNFETKISEASKAKPAMELIKKLNEEELYVIRRFLTDRHMLTPERQNEVASKLAVSVRHRLNIKGNYKDETGFLEMIYKEHAHEDVK